MRIYAFQKLSGVATNNLYLEHWLNGLFHKGQQGTRCYHYDLPEDEAMAWVRAGIARVIPKGQRFPCVQHAAGPPSGKGVY